MLDDNADPKELDNIIRGPWKSKRVKVPDQSVFELQQDLIFIEELCESVMVQVIYTLGENGVDIGDKEFLQDIAFVIESLKSTLYREQDMMHPFTNLIRHISEIVIEESDDDEHIVATKFSITKLTKLLEKIEEDDSPDPNLA
jgi:hypothetical protein